jgi:cysteine desulfurase/selenocysteine lyase
MKPTPDVERLRDDFPPLKTFTWFQNGGVSITPRPVAEAHAALMRELFERGPMHIAYPDEEYPRRAATKARIARFLGVASDQIAFMRGVSESYQTVLRGLEWRRGDQVLVTEEEEPSLLVPTLHLRDVYGLEVHPVPLLSDLEEQVHAFAERITERTRLIAISHVTTDTGHRLPVERICALPRPSTSRVFLDMAHSAGLWPIDVGALGCDYAGVLSYKWMYGPYAAGALALRPDRLEDIEPRFVGGRAEASVDYGAYTYVPKAGAERFQYGPWSWPLIHAWSSSLDYLESIGLEWIWTRTARLATMLKTELLRVPGLHLFTPTDAERSAALVAFSLEGWDGLGIERALRDRWQIVVRSLIASRGGVRASIGFFTLESEIDRLVEAVGQLGRERG